MKLIKWGNHPEMDNSLLEASLQDVLQPLQPRAEFVRKLRVQLVNELEPVQEQIRNEKQRVVWVVGASLLGGMLALLMGVRTIMTLGVALGLLVELNKQTRVEKAVPVRQKN